jgi:hypothetical protein
MNKEPQPATTEKLTVTLDADLARRLGACSTIERRKIEEVIPEASQAYIERKKLKV